MQAKLRKKITIPQKEEAAFINSGGKTFSLRYMAFLSSVWCGVGFF